MFKRDDIVEFIEKIISSNNVKEEDAIQNINQFYKYVQLTKMADVDTLNSIKRVIECLPEIIKLKKKCGNFDISSIFYEEKKNDISTRSTYEMPKVMEKHYNHYHYDDSSSSSGCGCGTSRGGC